MPEHTVDLSTRTFSKFRSVVQVGRVSHGTFPYTNPFVCFFLEEFTYSRLTFAVEIVKNFCSPGKLISSRSHLRPTLE